MNISKEDQLFLEDLSRKINSQDKRGTSHVYFVVYDKEKEYGENGYGYDERERDTDRDFDVDDLCESCKKLYDNDEDLPEDCLDCDGELFHYYRWVDRIQEDDGVFFTSEACDEYIQRRRYNFNEPYSYGLSAYRSEEMKRVQDIIAKLTNSVPKLS